MSLTAIPLPLDEANALVSRWHRHHRPVVGHRFSIGAAEGDEVVGAVIVGRPVARMLDDGFTAEVTRCVTNGHRNACSFLYASAWRAWRAMGGRRLITYTLAEERGNSLVAAGWRALYQTSGGSWHRDSRPRVDTHPTGQKTLWEATA